MKRNRQGLSRHDREVTPVAFFEESFGDGSFIDSGIVIDLFGDDGEVARRALSGEPVVVLPVGTFFRGGKSRDVTPDVVSQFAANFANRQRVGIRRSRVAVDIDHAGGAVGWYKDVMATPDGLAASFSWTRKGREALEAGEYAYFSPTVYWEQVDRETGETVHNQIAGGALTNYPFFGDATALYSLRDGGSVFAVTKTEDGVQYPARAYLVVEDPEKVDSWHLRVYSWQGGKLSPDHKLMGAAKAALTSEGGHMGNPYEGPQKADATRRLRALYESEGLEFHGGETVDKKDTQNLVLSLDGVREFFRELFKTAGDGDGGGFVKGEFVGVPVGDFQKLEAQVSQFGEVIETLTGERDAARAEAETLKASMAGLQGAMAGVQLAREAERFAVVAGAFKALPVTPGDLAGHLQWLSAMDSEENKPHYAFFSELLGKVDNAMADFAFSEAGSSRGLGSVAQQIAAKVSAYMADNKGASYEDAMNAVMRSDPSLYTAYRQEVLS